MRDDIDLVIPPTNADTIDTELLSVEAWARQNNLVLNYAKSHHMVVRRPRFPRDHVSIKGVSSINRVYEMKVLGVTFSDTLSLSPHVKYLSAKSAQNAFALMVCQGGPYGQLLKPTSSHGSRMPVPCGGVFVTPVRGISLLWWSPDWQERTICLQISQLSTKWWSLRTSNSSIKLCQTPPTYLLHSSHPQNHTHIICESAPMISRSLHTKLTF